MLWRLKKILLIVLGGFCVLLAIAGAVLPLLPTTPFLLLALACFANSSPRFHQMLLNNRWFGETLRQWEDSRTISPAAKKKAMLLLYLWRLQTS